MMTLDRMALVVANVRERLERATAAQEGAGIACAVIGGNAVFLWVEAFGEGGERYTPNVDLLICRADLAATATLINARFVAVEGRADLFLDEPGERPRTRLRLLFAEEKVKDADSLPNPGCGNVIRFGPFAVLPLAALVQTKLVAYRTVDRVHLLDLLDVGLIDSSWTHRYPPELAERLQSFLNDPDAEVILPGKYGIISLICRPAPHLVSG